MTVKTKLAMFATIVALGTASPALAQSVSRDFGTGNVTAFENVPQEAEPIVVRHSGLYDFATVLSDQAPVNSNARALTGGGSTGYNELIEQY